MCAPDATATSPWVSVTMWSFLGMPQISAAIGITRVGIAVRRTRRPHEKPYVSECRLDDMDPGRLTFDQDLDDVETDRSTCTRMFDQPHRSKPTEATLFVRTDCLTGRSEI